MKMQFSKWHSLSDFDLIKCKKSQLGQLHLSLPPSNKNAFVSITKGALAVCYLVNAHQRQFSYLEIGLITSD